MWREITLFKLKLQVSRYVPPGRVIPSHHPLDRRFTGFWKSQDRPDPPEKPPPEPHLAYISARQNWTWLGAGETVRAVPTRYAPNVSTDRPGIGSDRIWVRPTANTGSHHYWKFSVFKGLELHQIRICSQQGCLNIRVEWHRRYLLVRARLCPDSLADGRIDLLYTKSYESQL